MTEYHRNSKRFVQENCMRCAKSLDECPGIYVFLGIELRDSGI